MWALTQLLFSMWPCCCRYFPPFSLCSICGKYTGLYF